MMKKEKLKWGLDQLSEHYPEHGCKSNIKDGKDGKEGKDDGISWGRIRFCEVKQ